MDPRSQRRMTWPRTWGKSSHRKAATCIAVKLAGWKQTYTPRCWRFGDTVRVASAETRSCLSLEKMIGVWPSGAQVRRRVGMSRKPLSSRNARWAPSLRAFFYSRPFVALPVRDRGLVALDGVACWSLTAPLPAPQHLPHVRGVIAHTAL